ncbi:MAG: bifunctional phosphopantothenoylcysteine decarboxylase/phosphopantothenate--cysteine ligase CoaBC, partial [Bacteriovoracaceae bacterium]
IILGITGSIAAYKGLDLARLLVKNGDKVIVVLSRGALEFVKPETFRYLGVENVFGPQDDFVPENLAGNENVLHIQLAKWAYKIVIAPLSANTLGKISLGLPDDLLMSIVLASGKTPLLLFPAMNTEMWNHPRTQEHVTAISKRDNIALINPAEGLLACGDIGKGKFPEVTAVADFIETLNPGQSKKGKVIVTAGATVSPLDPVRYITNPSSGKMGIAVGKAFLKAGYDVTVLAGHQCDSSVENLQGHPHFTLVKAPTTEIMKNEALKRFPTADLYISTGAIADIEFEPVTQKIKKENMGDSIPFRKAADIMKEILSIRKSNQKVVSFAAETETTKGVFMEKMNRKPVDLMVGNKVNSGLLGGDISGFQKTGGEYFFVTTKDIKGPYPLSKKEVGEKLREWFEGKLPW